MSAELWQQLHSAGAYRTSLAPWELAHVHVPLGSLGISPAPEPALQDVLTRGEGVAMLTGPPGAGKSSVLAYTADQLAGQRGASGQRFLPLFVSVASRGDVLDDLDRLGQEVIAELLSAMAPTLPKATQTRLRQALAAQVSRQHTPARFNAKLVAKLFGAGPEMGVSLAEETITTIGPERLDSYGGLKTLGDITRSRGHEMIVLFEDTDAWSNIAGGGDLAEKFFARLRSFIDAEVAIAVAVQDHWLAELPSCQALEERAETSRAMPTLTRQHAASLVGAVISRRAEWGLGSDSPSDPPGQLFTPEALEALSDRLHAQQNLRATLAWLRNTLDRYHGALPDQIGRNQLLEAG